MVGLISIVLPVYNEANYLEQCLESLISQQGANLEFCISDNASSDNTWQIITRYSERDPRIKSVRHLSPVHPFENYRHALDLATGEYVFPMGGDDYLRPGLFKEVTSQFSRNAAIAAVLVRMHYFSDRTGQTLATLPPPDFESKLNEGRDKLVPFFLKNVDHDEVLIGVFRADSFKKAWGLISPNTAEAPGIWLFWAVAHDCPTSVCMLKVTAEVFLMKRYDKIGDAGGFGKTVSELEAGQSRYRVFCLKNLASIVTATRYLRAGLFDLKDFLRVLFSHRYHSDFGYCGAGPIVDTICVPFRVLVNKAKARFARWAEAR